MKNNDFIKLLAIGLLAYFVLRKDKKEVRKNEKDLIRQNEVTYIDATKLKKDMVGPIRVGTMIKNKCF